METVASPENLAEFVKLVTAAAAARNWAMVAAFALVAAVWALRKFGAPKAPFFATPEGGAVLNLATSFSGAFLTALVAGTPFSWGLLLSAFQVSLLAAGGWGLASSLLFPLLLKIPLLANVFGRGSAAEAEARAKAAGLAAANVVAAKPPSSDSIANGP